MKKILFALLLTYGFAAKAQVYNNEWIDYSKTYYKFKVGKTGVYRISQQVLSNAGLGTTPAENFQLWRNGEQVALYTSIASGPLASTDYIEFWGLMNDGKPDRQMYRKPSYLLNDKFSLESDTSVYFLTINNNTAENLRLTNKPNDVAGNTLPVEPFFIYTAGKYFNDRMNAGFAANVGDYLYSSSYDKAEGWASPALVSTVSPAGIVNGTLQFVFNNLAVYNGGPAPTFKITASGNSIIQRRYRVNINQDSVYGTELDYINDATDSTNFNLATLHSTNDTVTVTCMSQIGCYPPPVGCQVDYMVVHKYEITYPRQFNFGGASNFEFTLPATAAGYYLNITNFSYGSTPPVLMDMTNGDRFTADISAAPVLKFALPASANDRNFILVSEDPSLITAVSSLQAKNFIDYRSAAFQGNYLIITNPVLFNGAGGSNPVNDYRLYRSSAIGGSYNAKIYLSDEIIDQFGFGIKKNPNAIRNFIRYARLNYTTGVKQVFIIGRGVNYTHQRFYENQPDIDQLNLVPTFGWPASDVLLTAEPGSSQPEVPIGRLSAINAQEVAVYLKKVKEYELALATPSPLIADRAWMKNVVHIIGAGEPGLDATLTQNMARYETTIRDTLFGANVETFSKSSSDYIEQLNSTRLQNLFDDGISIITYFGHSSSSTLEFNLDNPENYNNFKKYPMFIGLGCNAGNFFNYSTVRLQTKETLSEKYVLTPDRGTIGFIASTHFGIVHYLDIWATRAYQEITDKSYGKTIGEILKATAEDVFASTTQEDFYARCNTEESELHGDPAIRLNPQPKPDYVVEDANVRITPGFVSIADDSFRVQAKLINTGRAPDAKIVVEVKRTFPDNTVVIVKRDTIPGIRYIDSVLVNIPINPTHDKGLNRITITIDADQQVDEIYENNNTITKDVMIYEDEARPVYPYNYSIINNQNIKMIASTANPFSTSKQYVMEMDTTELFNSPLKISRTVTKAGGVMEFIPGISLIDSTVYYWRVAPVALTGSPTWNTSSFIYLVNSEVGFNQSHLYQHLKSAMQGIMLDSNSRKWNFGTRYENLFIRHGSWATSTGQEAGVSIGINGNAYIRNSCWYQCVNFTVFDPVTFVPWLNTTQVSNDQTGGLYGSGSNNCFGGRQNSFEYRWDSVANRTRAMNFMKNVIPDGAYVVVRSFLLEPGPTAFPSYASMIKYAPEWAADTQVNGSGNSLYHALKNAGFSGIDSFYKPRNFAFVYKKNDPSFTPRWVITNGTYDNVTLSVDCAVPDTLGRITSPVFGPARQWKQLRWNGTNPDALPGDNPRIDIVGIRNDGSIDTVMRRLNLSQKVVDISSIDAAVYPNLQLYMRNADSVNNTPYQLSFWRATYLPVPEGALSPNDYFSMTKDTFDVAETVDFQVAFKNTSGVNFSDSMKVKLIITDRDNVQHVMPVNKFKPLAANDTLHIHYPIDTRQLVGSNYLYLEVNPDNDQPEQYHFNNTAYKPFYVRPDTLNPLMDVTFDNMHILNYDIVSPKPNIVIKLKDEAKFFLQDDPSKLTVKIRALPNPDTTSYTHEYAFDGDTLQFIPAQQSPDHDNTASAIFKPTFKRDGKYELIVSGKDMSENQAGTLEYRVTFEVINKPMISNMLNYPNPFTTSTAFVFTLTGTEVPQNIKIQIMTITGKVVREVTKNELGPLHIGRNITEFKWDGTDQYGQKLANGVYLYRVVTNLNGKSLDKYTSKNEETDQYFNKGYGKMYLMR